MSGKATLAQLFDHAIAAERAAEAFYHGLETKFAHHEDVAAFWAEYAAEETMHAGWLESMRDGLSPERLSTPADPLTMEKAHGVLQFSVENTLKGVKNLEDAYQLVNELENSETNAIFEFLIANFAEDEKTQAFLRSQLRDHVGKLMIDFPVQFKQAKARQRIKVRSD
jgi:rubrerythrin